MNSLLNDTFFMCNYHNTTCMHYVVYMYVQRHIYVYVSWKITGQP